MFFKTFNNQAFYDITIPSIFLDTFIPIATGNQLKVFLLGYREAFFGSITNNSSLDNNEIASTVGISVEDVISAWKFWENMEVVKIHGSDNDMKIEFLDFKTELLKKIPIDDSEKEENIENLACSAGYIDMYRKIETICGRVLSPGERLNIIDAVENYDMTLDMVILAFEKALAKNGRIKSIPYVLGFLKNWFDRDLKTVEEVESAETLESEELEKHKKIMGFMGIYRLPKGNEKKILNRWLYEYNMPLELIELACNKAPASNNISLNYIDTILSNWNKKGIRTVEDADMENTQFKKNRSRKDDKSGAQNNTQKQVNTKFHNFDQGISKEYNDSELKDLVRNLNKD